MTRLASMPLESLLDTAKKPKAFFGTEVIWNLNLDQIESHTGRVMEKRFVTPTELGSSTHHFEAGTVLYSKLRPYLNKVVVADQSGFATTELVPLRCDAKVALPEYLAHYLRSNEFVRFATNVVAGAKMPRMVMSAFWSHDVPLPPLTEQRRIAAILDQADTLRAKRREALAQLDSLTQSIFIEMFGDPAMNQKHWPKHLVKDIGMVVTGNTPPRANPENYGDEIEWIKSDNINTPSYYLTQAEERLSQTGREIARTVPAGSILVTCIAGSPDCIGNSAMTDREVAFNQQINAFIPTEGNAHFYYGQIQVGKRLIQEASTNGMKGMVSKGRFEQIEFIVPPLKMQEIFATRVLAVQKQCVLQSKSLAEVDALFASLQHRGFRGEL